MISRQDAEQIAAEWARRESVRRGYECTPMMSEFDLGYVVWTKEPPAVLPMPGDGITTVIDKESGEISSWPGLPPQVVEQMYRQRRDSIVAAVRTADPEVELRRNARRRPVPTVAAHVTLRYDQFVARGAKGDQTLRHHRLVRDYLDDLPDGHLVRGGDRHAELIVLSDILHEYDQRNARTGQPPLTEETARILLRDAQVEFFHVRDAGDPLGGQPARPCESCIKTLVYFGMLPWSHLAFVEEWRPEPRGEAPQPGRFPDEVAWVLADGGWSPRETDDMLAESAIERVCAIPGEEHRHIPFAAAHRLLTDFPGVVCGRRGPGQRHWIRVFDIDPSSAAQTADVLADFATVVGARLFPIGSEGKGDSVLAVDEYGRIFALDQGGEWFLGDDIDTAIVNLVTGGPTARVRDNGSW
jgi:hypothetical protein